MGTKEGIFQLYHNTNNVSNLNRLLTARELLTKRLIEISHKKNDKGVNLTPGILDITQTHEFILDAVFKPMVALGLDWTATPCIGGGKPELGGDIKFSLPKYGDFVHSQFVHIRISQFGDTTSGNTYRYCNKPGIRLIENVSYKNNGNPLDSYNYRDVLFYDKFEVSSDKRLGWNRCIGEDNGTIASYWHPLQQVDQLATVKNGPQTRKSVQPALDLYLPLHFWFNKDASKSLPRIQTSALQHFIEMKLANIDNLVQCYDSTGTKIPIPDLVKSNIRIEKCALYTNFIYVEEIVKEIYFNKITFQLITVHQSMYKPDIFNEYDEISLQPAVKYPIETMYWAFQPAENNTIDTWDKFCKLTLNDICIPAIVVPFPAPPPPAPVGVKQLVVRDMMFYEHEPVIDTFYIKSAGNSLVDESPAKIFSNYHPYSGDVHNTGILAQLDDCAYMYSWAVRPLDKVLTGFINTSIGRELYLGYKSREGLINTTNKVNFIFSTKAYNFFYVSDNTSHLRFSE